MCSLDHLVEYGGVEVIHSNLQWRKLGETRAHNSRLLKTSHRWGLKLMNLKHKAFMGRCWYLYLCELLSVSHVPGTGLGSRDVEMNRNHGLSS